jgi:cyclopropane-fatty-acyl-phospholipid synthase
MDVLTTTKGQSGLPRYFAQAFEVAKRMEHGRLDMVLPDGRRFRAEGAKPGPGGRDSTSTTTTSSRG